MLLRGYETMPFQDLTPGPRRQGLDKHLDKLNAALDPPAQRSAFPTGKGRTFPGQHSLPLFSRF